MVFHFVLSFGAFKPFEVLCDDFCFRHGLVLKVLYVSPMQYTAVSWWFQKCPYSNHFQSLSLGRRADQRWAVSQYSKRGILRNLNTCACSRSWRLAKRPKARVGSMLSCRACWWLFIAVPWYMPYELNASGSNPSPWQSSRSPRRFARQIDCKATRQDNCKLYSKDMGKFSELKKI